MPDLEEIDTATIPTARVTTCVRWVPDRENAEPVVFVHGNVSSSPFFFPAMRMLPKRYRPVALDLRGFGGTEPAPVDATRGLADFSDDVLAALDALGLPSAHLVGWSLGGGVVLQALIDAPDRVTSVTLVNPISPFGFGGTHGVDGRLVAPDGAGSGAGSVSPAFVAALAAGDTSDRPGSPRALLRRYYTAPDWDGAGEEGYIAAMLSTVTGQANYPGDSVPSEHWPGFAPGRRGVMNAMAPVHLNLSAVVGIESKPAILWIRGEVDRVVSDASAMDVARRGAAGSLPGYPGVSVAPPQPMVSQTRWVLRRYAEAGGRYREAVIAGAGHSPHIENTPVFMEALLPHLDGASED